MMEKIFTGFVFFAFLISANTTFAYSFRFSDVGSDNIFLPAIEYIAQKGIVNGYYDGTYKPWKHINRAEFLKILIESKYKDDEINAYIGEKCFDDVDIKDWYSKYTCLAKDKGIIDGYDQGKKFKPANYINFVEAMKIMLETFGYEYKEYGASKNYKWYTGIVQVASEKNFISLYTSSYDEKIHRAIMADMIARILNYEAGTLKNYLGDTFEIKVTDSELFTHDQSKLGYWHLHFQSLDLSQFEYFEKGKKCITPKGKKGYGMEQGDKIICIEIGEFVPDTDCKVTEDGECAALED